MRFLSIYADYQGTEAGCGWIQEESEEQAIQRASFLYDNWADYLLLTEGQAQVVLQQLTETQKETVTG